MISYRKWQIYSNGRRNMVVPAEDRMTTMQHGLSSKMHISMHEQFGWLAQPALKTIRMVAAIVMAAIIGAWAIGVTGLSVMIVTVIVLYSAASGGRFILPMILSYVGYGYFGEVRAMDWRGALNAAKPNHDGERETTA